MDQQQRLRAIQPDTSFLVQAPAGSGKTSLLTQRFLRLLALSDEPEEVLAITFTRKAAAEMRARILGELRDAESEKPVSHPHRKQTRALANAALERDRERNWQVLASPRRLRIQTIDSFNASLVARLPLLSQLGFSPSSTERAAPIFEAAVQQALRGMAVDTGKPGSIGRSALIELLCLLDNNLEALAASLAELIAKRDQWLLVLGANPLGDGDSASLREELEGNIRLLLEPELIRLRAVAPEELGPEIASLARFAAENLAGTVYPIESLNHTENWPGADVDAIPAWRGIGALLFTGKGTLRQRLDKNAGFPADRKSEKLRMQALLNELEHRPAFCEALQRVLTLPDPFYTDGQWRVLEALFRFLGEGMPQLFLQFAERRETDFAEVSLRAVAALEASPGIPTLLAERLDAQIRHILVDEFQDTSVLQMLLLRKLTENWTPGDGRSLFLVGDPMQSIYGWRNARVDLFLRAWEGGLPGLPPLETLRLERNFRSRRALIETFNEWLAPHFPAENNASSGAVRYADAAPDLEEIDTDPERIHCHAFLDATLDAEADWIAAEVSRIRTETADNAEPCRIGVLFRKGANAASVGGALNRRGVAFQAIDVEPLAGLPVIQDLRAIWNGLLSPQDRLAWLSLLRAPWNALTLNHLEQLHTLAGEVSPGDPSIWNAIREQVANRPLAFDDETQFRLRRTVALCEEAFLWRGRRPLVDVLRNLWERSGASRYHGDARAQLAATQFFRLLTGIDETELLRGSRAMDDALANLFAPPDPEAPDTLQLLTIHKAKGLEFDIVFVPYLNAGRGSNSLPALSWEEIPLPGGSREAEDAALVIAPRYAVGEERSPINKFLADRKREREDYESVRVLYVAFTRAKERLHLLATINPANAASVADLSPKRNSSLAKLWPHFEDKFRAVWDSRPPAIPEDSELPETSRYPLLRRLQVEDLPQWSQPAWKMEAVATGDEPRFFKPHGAFETLDTAAGTVFHRLMDRMGAGPSVGEVAATADRLLPLVIEEMRELLPGEIALDDDAARVVEALRKVGNSKIGQWVFHEGHRDLSSEQDVGAFVNGEWRTVRIDRMFRDGTGMLHIVDFKLVDAQPTDLAAFRISQRRLYASQIENYARLLQLQRAEPITVMLYFPLQDLEEHWVVAPQVERA